LPCGDIPATLWVVSAALYPLPNLTAATAALLALAAGVALPVYLLFYRPVGDERTWGLAEIGAISILFMLTLPVAFVLAGVAEPLTLTGFSAATLAQNGLFVGLSAYVVAIRYRQDLARLGLRAADWPRAVALGAGAAILTVPVAMGAEHVAVFLLGLVEGPAQAAARAAAEHLTDPLLPVLSTLGGPLEAAWFLALVVVVVPVGEEVFFRGLVYGALRARWGAVAAAVASALFFTAVHLQVVHALPIFVLGVILAGLYERTGTLVPAIVAHAANNVVAVVALWRGWGW
jgi:membrane protease YdiL (CAAX protease family)